MLGVNFDFFKICQWGARAALKAVFSPVVWYPLLIITCVGIVYGLWTFIDTSLQPVYDLVNFQVPQYFDYYVLGDVAGVPQGSISQTLCYVFGVDVVANLFFKLPQILIETLATAITVVLALYAIIYVNHFKIRAYNALIGLFPR